MKYLVALVLSVCLAGCQSAYTNGQPNERSPYSQVPAGAKLILEGVMVK